MDHAPCYGDRMSATDDPNMTVIRMRVHPATDERIRDIVSTPGGRAWTKSELLRHLLELGLAEFERERQTRRRS